MPRAQLGLPLNLGIFLKIMISLEFHGISLDIKILEMFMNSLGKLLSSGTLSPHATTPSRAGNGLLSPPDRLRQNDEAGPSRIAWEFVAMRMRNQHVQLNAKQTVTNKHGFQKSKIRKL